ncbi:hypothetical protein Tco_0933058 [Tanacetum coccineum]
MSDSKDSTVTYTSISSDDGSLEVGSPGMVVYEYDELPMHPPSPDYVPGPEHPPSPVYVPYVPEPVYPEFMPPEDDVLLAEEQPLPAAVSPTADSLDDDDDEEEEDPSRDDANDEEEEHLAPADSVPPPAYRTTSRMSIRDQTPIPFPSKAEELITPSIMCTQTTLCLIQLVNIVLTVYLNHSQLDTVVISHLKRLN